MTTAQVIHLPTGGLPIARRAVLDRRRGLACWAVGLGALVAVQIALYPTVRDMFKINDEMLRDAPDAMKALLGGDLDFSSGPGYVRGEVFAFTLPLLFLIFAIGAGAAAVAGDEERGTLGLVLAHPVARRRLVAERFAAFAATTTGLAASVLAVLALVASATGLPVPMSSLGAAMAGVLMLSLLHGGVAFAVGCATGRRAIALGAAAAFAVVGYLIESLSAVTDVVRPLRPLSPFHWANPGALAVGNTATGLVWALLAVALLALLSTQLFERRDVVGS